MAPVELDEGKDSVKDPVELPASHHDGASELPGHENADREDGQTGSSPNGDRTEGNTETDGTLKVPSVMESTGDR